jgi:hypothetical protein
MWWFMLLHVLDHGSRLNLALFDAFQPFDDRIELLAYSYILTYIHASR